LLFSHPKQDKEKQTPTNFQAGALENLIIRKGRKAARGEEYGERKFDALG